MNCKIKRTNKSKNEYSVNITGMTRGGILALQNALVAYSQAGSSVAGDVLSFLTQGMRVSDEEVQSLLHEEKTSSAKPERFTVVIQEWEESERGWGVRPDGASLHLNSADREAYVKNFWELEKSRNPKGDVPDEYSRTSGEPKTMDVDRETYDKIKTSKNGVMLWQSEYTLLRNKMKGALT